MGTIKPDRIRREFALEADIIKAAKLRGWRQRKVVYVGRTGAPDRWFKRAPGQLVIMEIKDPEGHRSVAQKKEVRWLTEAGFTAHFVETLEQAIAIFESFDKKG